MHDPTPDPCARADFLMRGYHIVTPAQRGRTHYFRGVDGAGIFVRKILNKKLKA